MTTDVSQFFAELDASVFESKLSAILSNVAAAAIDNNRKGKVVITLDISRIGSSYQVNVAHTLKYERPTPRGVASETDQTSTPMHVGTGGAMSFFPENQGRMFGKQGQVDMTVPTHKEESK